MPLPDESEEPGMGMSDLEDSSSSASSEMDLGQFKDIVLPKSNSLPHDAQFSRTKHHTSKDSPLPVIAQIDTFTFPSKKLFPHISILTILGHAGSKEMLESKANLAIMRLEAMAPTGAVTMQEEDDLQLIVDD